ncbi:hypothetical protein [Methanobrevibacter sp.]
MIWQIIDNIPEHCKAKFTIKESISLQDHYKKEFQNAKNAYKNRDYKKAYEIYTRLYSEVPFDNSNKYSYAWTIYQARIKDYTSKEELLSDADRVCELTRQNNLNHTKLCVYTMSVIKVLKLLYYENDYESLPYWLDKLKPELLDQTRHTRDDRIYPSNMEQYYIYASVTYFKLKEYEKCIEVSREALGRLNRFTDNSAEFFQWRIAKSYRQLGDCEQSLKFLKILQLNEWYVYHEMAEAHYCLKDYESSLKCAVKAARLDGPMDMKYNLYRLLEELLQKDYPDVAEKHEMLCELILFEDDEGKNELERELLAFWKRLDNQL